MGFPEPRMGDWLQSCSAIAGSLQINATLCLRFDTPRAWGWQLGTGLEKTRNKMKMFKREGIE